MILICGATGTMGSELTKQLAGQNEAVRALVRSPNKAEWLSSYGVRTVSGDLAQPKTLGPALKDISKVFMLSSADPHQVQYQHNMIEACKKAAVQLVVKLSALGAAPNSPVQLAQWHYQSEEDLKTSGLPFVILRPSFFMQNLLMNAESIQREGKIYAAAKNGRIGMVDVRDVAAVAGACLLESGHIGKTYEITGGEAISYSDIARIFSELLKRRISYVEINWDEAHKQLRQMGVEHWMADDLCTLMEFFASGGGATLNDTVMRVAHKKPYTFKEFAQTYGPVFVGRQKVAVGTA